MIINYFVFFFVLITYEKYLFLNTIDLCEKFKHELNYKYIESVSINKIQLMILKYTFLIV